MASGPDLFVVCKSCGSEVSPYITECPYCGTRLRKRAPKLDRGGVPKAPRQSRRPSLGRLRPGEIPGIRADRRPYATILIVVATLVVSLGASAGAWSLLDLGLYQGVTGESWRAVTTLFVYAQTAYEVVALAAIFLFGWLLERRHGPVVVIAVFFGASVLGALAALAVYPLPFVDGGNAGALALLACWAAPDLQALRVGQSYEGDLLGAGAFAALLLAAPFARPEASWLAGVVGGAVGLLAGLGFGRSARGRG
jgi:hypothetical protein